MDLLRVENVNSPFFINKYEELASDDSNQDDYEVRDGLLMYKGKLLLDHTSPLVHSVLQECHSTPSGGHGGNQKTMAMVSATFIWHGFKKDVKKFV